MRLLPRRAVLCAPLACLFVLATAVVSCADSIDLTFSSQRIHFRGDGRGTDTIQLLLGACNEHGICNLRGRATGPDPDKGTFTITLKNPIVLTDDFAKKWIEVPAANTTTFCYGRKCSLLAGTLVLLRFSGIGDGTFTFIFKATGGSLESLFTNSHGDFTMTLTSRDPRINLARVLGTKRSISERFSGGGILSSVPEPDSWVLFGSGLLALAGGVGRRLSS